MLHLFLLCLAAISAAPLHVEECSSDCTCDPREPGRMDCSKRSFMDYPYSTQTIYPYIIHLDLAYNKLDNAPPHPMDHNFPNLQTLDMTGNPIFCRQLDQFRTRAAIIAPDCIKGK